MSLVELSAQLIMTQVPPPPRGAHPHERRRQLIPVRARGGRPRPAWRLPLQGPHGHRRRRSPGQHHRHRAPCPPALRAAPLLPRRRRPQGPAQPEALRAEFPAGIRPLLHPDRQARGGRRAAGLQQSLRQLAPRVEARGTGWPTPSPRGACATATASGSGRSASAAGSCATAPSGGASAPSTRRRRAGRGTTASTGIRSTSRRLASSS